MTGLLNDYALYAEIYWLNVIENVKSYLHTIIDK